jgi:hypothetical protein
VLAEARRVFDRLLYSRQRLGERAEQVGRMFSHGEYSGTNEAKLYTIGRLQRGAEGLPLRIRFDPVGISADILQSPRRSESLGCIQDILALPETTPGRWATALIVMLAGYWRTHVNDAGKCWAVARPDGAPGGLSFGTVTRAFVFDCVLPDPPATPEQVLADANHRGRAPGYFAAALDLLTAAKLIDCCIATPTRYAKKHGREPWPHTAADGARRRAARGFDWPGSWRKQVLELRPGGPLLAELLALRAHKTRGLKRG